MIFQSLNNYRTLNSILNCNILLLLRYGWGFRNDKKQHEKPLFENKHYPCFLKTHSFPLQYLYVELDTVSLYHISSLPICAQSGGRC